MKREKLKDRIMSVLVRNIVVRRVDSFDGLDAKRYIMMSVDGSGFYAYDAEPAAEAIVNAISDAIMIGLDKKTK